MEMYIDERIEVQGGEAAPPDEPDEPEEPVTKRHKE
jgi:hypothetical protein